MVVIINGDIVRLPFTTVVVDQFLRNHQHRERDGLCWIEPMDLSVHVMAIRLDEIVPAHNDNQVKCHG